MTTLIFGDTRQRGYDYPVGSLGHECGQNGRRKGRNGKGWNFYDMIHKISTFTLPQVWEQAISQGCRIFYLYNVVYYMSTIHTNTIYSVKYQNSLISFLHLFHSI